MPGGGAWARDEQLYLACAHFSLCLFLSFSIHTPPPPPYPPVLFSYSSPPTLGGTSGYSAEELAALGLLTFAGSKKEAEQAGRRKDKVGQQREPGPSTSSQSLVNIGPGLRAVSRRLIDRIKANEFVDFAELPPAKGKSRPPPQVGEGQIVVLQAADLAPTRRTILDLATWLQCFGLYMVVIAQSQPERVPELMAYQAIIANASTKYTWPSWLVYDTSFRQEVAGTVGQSWARVDPSIYSVCFFGQNISGENWCQSCQSLTILAKHAPPDPRRGHGQPQ